MEKGGCVYIMTNKNRTTLYIGATVDLRRRTWQHKNKYYPRSFTARYNVDQLVYYEVFPTIGEALDREKQLKKTNRRRKERLINSLNPSWRDLWEDIQNW